MGSEDQGLRVQSKKSRTDHHRGKKSHQKRNTRKYNKYLSKYIFFTCDERGHLARDCPRNIDRSHKRKGNKKRHQQKNDSEKPIEECKDLKCGDHPVLLYKGLLDQGTNRSGR